jgi:hypothetical protein
MYMQPTNNEGEMAIIISGIDLNGLNSAWRLLPKRTGMMIPEWSMFLLNYFIKIGLIFLNYF